MERSLACIFILLSVSASGSRTHSTSDSEADGICRTMVEPYNYPCQEHKVTTEDGYILSLQNIRHGRSGKTGEKRPPVLLQHGLLGDAVTWLVNTPDESLPLILADQGFDVWLVSTRGTKYSRQHTSLLTSYWNWSWQELVAYDLPSTLQYVRNLTGQKLHYIGHSQGTLMVLAALSEGLVSNSLRSAALLCPIAYISHLTSPIVKALAENFLSHTSHWLKIHEFNPTGPEVIKIVLEVCKKKGIQECLNSLAGGNCCVNSSTLGVLLQHEPQPTSTKNVIHLAQMMKNGTVKKFDYGDEKTNKKHYGAATPPSYDMAKIPDDVPLFVAHGGADTVSVRKDVNLLLHSLRHHQRDKLVVEYREEYGHGDYIMGFNARQAVYDSLIAFLWLW